ncbi:MAG: ribonuclease HII [Treponema sp.]|jgi:ribonuclease HII|nr:ribonuclease HII [Treponema sp.]
MKFLCGLDEAGRGPLAGPVAAGAVILPPDFPVQYLNDSKKLSAKKRLAAEILIKEKACWGIGFVDHEVIDRINILQASLYAMQLACEMALLKFPSWLKENHMEEDVAPEIEAVADGTFCPKIAIRCRCQPKADALYPPVMAASIIAKTGRDRLMIEYDSVYPGYGYARHKGYPTPEHKKICREKGPSPIQRLSFRY